MTRLFLHTMNIFQQINLRIESEKLNINLLETHFLNTFSLFINYCQVNVEILGSQNNQSFQANVDTIKYVRPWNDWFPQLFFVVLKHVCLFRSLRLRRRCWGRRGSWRTPGGNWLRSDSSSTSSCPASCEKTTTEVQPEVHCCVHAEQCEKHTCWMCMYVWIFVSFITAHPLVSHSDFRHSYIHFLPGLLSAADVSRTLGLKKNCYFMFLFSFFLFFFIWNTAVLNDVIWTECDVLSTDRTTHTLMFVHTLQL